MDLSIRPFSNDDMDAVVDLSLLAWEPVFQSFEQVLGSAIYTLTYPEWQRQQREVVMQYCQSQAERSVWVADIAGTVAGFIVYELNHATKTGEVMLLAVHPTYQNEG